jgi:dihydroxy-acid dehydratase
LRAQAVKNSLELEIPTEELDARRQAWKPRPPKVTSGSLWKYAQLVADASHGAVTDGATPAEAGF